MSERVSALVWQLYLRVCHPTLTSLFFFFFKMKLISCEAPPTSLLIPEHLRLPVSCNLCHYRDSEGSFCPPAPVT